MQKAQNKAVHKKVNGRILRLFLALLGIAANVCLSFLMNKMGLPLFLDNFGTIAVSAISGILFTGILTAVISSLICSLFFSASIYFSFFNALIAIFTVWFVHKYSFRKIWHTILFILVLILYSTLVNSMIQFAIFSDAQTSVAAQNARSLAASGEFPYLISFCLINFLISVLDKGFTFILVISMLNFIPKEKIISLQNSVWKQRPLSDSELRSIKNWSHDVKHSLRTRTTLTLVITSLVLILVMVWTGGQLYFENKKVEKSETAMNCAKFAADVINPNSIDDFIKHGQTHPDYEKTADMLYKILKISPDVRHLYVLRVDEDGGRFIFDINASESKKDRYEPDLLLSFHTEVEPYLQTLLGGDEIKTVESHTAFTWFLKVFYPVRDASGKSGCYVGIEISLDYMNAYLTSFISHILMIMAGFFILIIAYAIWTTGVYTSYPISSIAACVDSFASTGENQEKLDDNVRTIRSLDIHTGDEVEKLYKAICRMTLNQAEQMRDIMRLSESTLKMQDGLIITMADMVESRDSDTGAHVQKTAAYVKIIVEGLKKKGYYSQKITPKFMSDVVRSAPLHDVGKINIPDGVLNKPGKLTDEEFAIMKSHTSAGKHILENAISTVQGENYLKEARNMAAYHHERWDGKGYPEGLHGEVIPLSARIMAVADVFDALASPRVYKPAFPLEKALAILQEGAGTQFDAKCVEVFMDSLSEVKMILKKYNPTL